RSGFGSIGSGGVGGGGVIGSVMDVAYPPVRWAHPSSRSPGPEGFDAGPLVQLLEALELVARPLLELAEARRRGTRAERRRDPQGAPQLPLECDAGLQPFDLDDAARRRVAHEPPVALEAGEPLADGAEHLLERARLDIGARH